MEGVGEVGMEIGLTWKDAVEAVPQKKWILVGKLITKKSLNKAAVTGMIRKGWNLQQGLDIIEHKDGTYTFRFDDANAWRRILRGRPWAVQGQLLNVQQRVVNSVSREARYNYFPIWVQFHNLPLEAMLEENIPTMCEAMGTLMQFERPEVNGRMARSFIRARIKLDVSKPLINGFWVPRPGKSRVWVDVKYEWLPDYCYHCGCIGHERDLAWTIYSKLQGRMTCEELALVIWDEEERVEEKVVSMTMRDREGQTLPGDVCRYGEQLGQHRQTGEANVGKW